MGQLPDLSGMFIMLAVICGVIGWGVIEFAGWVLSHLSWVWG